MENIRANHPVEEILAFRETGYADALLRLLPPALGPDWDVYLHFELSKWKGNPLRIEASPRKKLVLCIGDESPRADYPFLNEVDLVFRMYLPENQRGKIYHVPVGPSHHFAPSPLVPFAERPHNVFFSGNLHLGRAGLYRALTRLPDWLPFAVLHRLKKVLGERFDGAFPNSIVRFSTGFHNGIAPEDYARMLGESKIVLCPPGVENPETMRHFESASLGCVVVTEALPDVAVYRNAPFVVLASWRELRATVARLLAEPNRLLDLHHQTLAWWRSTSRPEAVAETMVGHARQLWPYTAE